jgi:hypothetical protein
VAERRGQAPRHPLTADLAGVLAAAQQERAPAQGPDAVSWGVGEAVLRFARRLAGSAFLRGARRTDGNSPVHNPRISA